MHVCIIAEASRASAIKNIRVELEVSIHTYQVRTDPYDSRLRAQNDYAACHQGNQIKHIRTELATRARARTAMLVDCDNMTARVSFQFHHIAVAAAVVSFQRKKDKRDK